MRSPSPRMLALAAAVALLAVAAVDLFVPYLTRERTVVSGVPVPTPFSFQAPVELGTGQRLCMGEVAFDTDSEVAEFTAISEGVGPALGISAEAPGYQASATVPGGYGAPRTLHAELNPPQRSVLGNFCVQNRGERSVTLLGTSEARTASRPLARIDGREIPADLSLRFLADERSSVADRLGSMIDRISAFKPPILEKPVLWLLLGLLVIGLPGGALYAIGSSFGQRD